MLPEEGVLLRIFIGESDRYEGKPLYEWIVLKARENDIAGATAIRGLLGFGANSRLHSAKILRISQDLPIIVEIIDTPSKIEEFYSIINHVIKEGLVTTEKAKIQFYRAEKPNPA